MALRFIAFASRARGAISELVEDVKSRLDLFEVAYASTTLTILVSRPSEYVELGDAGIVVGSVFQRQSSRLLGNASPELACRVRNTAGRSLLADIWGGYVAFVDMDGDRELHIIRDPSGTLPCLFCRSGPVLVAASDVETFVDAGFPPPAIDWAGLTRHLLAPDLKDRETALVGCRELLPGERLSLTFSGDTIDAVWTPWDHVTPDGPGDIDSIAARLRETISRCTKAWASRFENILLGVSGGLDSSVIAACLADQNTPWSALTMATQVPDGDERSYARRLTDALGMPLLERWHDVLDIDITRTSSAHLPRPFGLTFGQSQDRTKMALAEEFGFDAFFTGQGGDNIFCYMQSATPLIDRLRAQGPNVGTFETMRDIACMTETSLWDVAIEAGRRIWQSPRGYEWTASYGLIHPDRAAEYPRRPDHAWLHAPEGALPGKAAHIAKLLRVQSTVDGFSRKSWGPLITPLLSQPLLELCFSIPTWMWCTGGQNRAPVRRAFARDLPRQLTERRSKAGPISLAFELIERNRRQMREFLLDGRLVAEHIIDRQAVERLLDDRTPLRPPSHFDLMIATEAEAWVRHWTGQLKAVQPRLLEIDARRPAGESPT